MSPPGWSCGGRAGISDHEGEAERNGLSPSCSLGEVGARCGGQGAAGIVAVVQVTMTQAAQGHNWLPFLGLCTSAGGMFWRFLHSLAHVLAETKGGMRAAPMGRARRVAAAEGSIPSPC